MIYYTTGKGDGEFSKVGKAVNVAVETTAKVLLQRGIISEQSLNNAPKPIVSESIFPEVKAIDKPQRGRPKR